MGAKIGFLSAPSFPQIARILFWEWPAAAVRCLLRAGSAKYGMQTISGSVGGYSAITIAAESPRTLRAPLAPEPFTHTMLREPSQGASQEEVSSSPSTACTPWQTVLWVGRVSPWYLTAAGDAAAGGTAGWLPRCAELLPPALLPALVGLLWLHPQLPGFVTRGVLWLHHSCCVLWLFFLFLNIV